LIRGIGWQDRDIETSPRNPILADIRAGMPDFAIAGARLRRSESAGRLGFMSRTNLADVFRSHPVLLSRIAVIIIF